MSLDTVYEQQILPIAQDPFQRVTTLLICKNSLIRAGITHLLAGTRFALSDETFEDISKLPTLPDTVPALCIIGEKQTADGIFGIVAGLKAQHPSARVVILGDDHQPAELLQAFQAGLNGICSTSASRDALVTALELVMLGELFIPAAAAFAMLNEFSRERETQEGAPVVLPLDDGSAAKVRRLSAREAEILRCLMEGASNKVIARKFDVAETTVKVHIKAILRKIRAANRTQAAMWAARHLQTASGKRLAASVE